MWTFILSVVSILSAVQCQNDMWNLTTQHSLHRQSRALIFDGGGVNKVSCFAIL